eukprot:gene12973-8827_t
MFVETPTAARNIQKIRTALETSNAVLVQGEIGCGKSLAIDYLANLMGFKDTLIQVDVDDSFDSKDLLGKFSATETPGTFEWLPGPLTLAVEEGHWLLMEDIDLASFDVFSVLLSLLENSTLFLSDKNKVITAHPNFKLVATQQILVAGEALFSKKNTIPYQELWGSVILNRIPPNERCVIVQTLYDKVPASVLDSLTSLSESCANPNVINLRTLLRWGRRVNRRLEGSSQGPTNYSFLSSAIREMMLKEAFDCFVARFPPGSEQQSMLSLIADACGVPLNIAETITMEAKPQQVIRSNGCTFGRVSLPLNTLSRITRQSRIAFAETRQAMSLLERLAAGVESKEHILLTGETGVGKTFVVQYLADQLGQNLIVHNLNQQTDTSDFMGGWKPLDLGVSMRELYNSFTDLFSKCFNVEKNSEFLNAIQGAFSSRNWERTARLIQKGCSSFTQKREKQEGLEEFAGQWEELKNKADEALQTILQTSSTIAFFYEEGSLVKAWREGHWILLDELNLATTEVLERVSTILGDVDRIFLTDKGASEPIMRHKNFHVFANMNPPTDVGKKDLPPSLRSRFTECFVSEPFNSSDINVIVKEYIGFLTPDAKVNEITDFFLDCVANAKSKLCALDGESKPPSFSMRTLTRALSYVRKATPWYGFNVSLFDGLLLGFATPLQRQFHKVVESLIVKNIFRGKQPAAPKLPTPPAEGHYIAYQHIWIKAGLQVPINDESFILTESVKGHLTNLARAVFAQRPVLLEGPTSSGKSSMVKYLAELTGNTFVRINNHESTEVQEYLGHYVTDEYGKLRFVDGILVNAVRNGYWVVLDELNLAPTDVLEALNRLLDDNCELFIPDTQETIQPHPDLRIFATQNPAGIYGGRKMLSRAFRNRFLEITVDEIPTAEIITILRQRYAMPEGFAMKIVEVMTNLQQRRQSSQIFAGRHGFITPRDLFRWAERKPETYQELAEHGFLLLGERCRKAAERQIVKDVLESVTKTEISEKELYHPSHWSFVKKYYDLIEDGSIDEFKIVWTESMQRLFTVVGICLEHYEPVLLVGETGSSKTTVCQLWAALLNVPLRILNCHQHTEAADFLGSLRPVPPDRRDTTALFEWRDGPLVECMRQGDIFLLDEISLTEDSVLERLNSVLEPSRNITLAEKSNGETFTAHDRFRVLATMNPGGDFGKKELSPALRNRFTEIYVRPTTDEAEVATILSKRLLPGLQGWALKMARVLCGVSGAGPHNGAPTHISVRDIVSWVEFMNAVHGRCPEDAAFAHGLDALLLDGVGVGSGQLEGTSEMLKQACLREAEKAVGGKALRCDERPIWEVVDGMEEPRLPPHLQSRFFFGAPATRRNLSKLMRSMILHKAVLLEGSPGVGKTSIVEALGAALSIRVVRINLSEQTDIMDLFGTFLPQPNEEEEGGPQFAWSDGVLLQALKEGCWAILDELNLASQSVLEGLNALLDHRSAVFIPELNQEFRAHPNFRVFACQNPLAEGGGRKGLPRSFLNRFVKVHVEAFTRDDLIVITQAVCPDIEAEKLHSMVDFVADLQKETMIHRSFGLRGSPWEFNLRDVLRWAGLMARYNERDNPAGFAEALFVQRFRADSDRVQCRLLLDRHFGNCGSTERNVAYSKDFLLVGDSVVYGGRHLIDRLSPRTPSDEEQQAVGGICHAPALTSTSPFTTSRHDKPLLLLPSQAETVSALLMCAAHRQFAMLIGVSGSGKTFSLRTAAALAGAELVTFSINASCDTIDLLGGFDQVEGKQGQFEWRDSLILEAMLQGQWLVLDNVNYCNASVLDRLNPLVEPDGVLAVNEQGLVNGATRVIRPHPNFRLFATMNPRYGEISRAMRNRAVELFLAPVAIPSIESSTLCWAASQRSPAQVEVDPPVTAGTMATFDLPSEKTEMVALSHLAAFHQLFVQQAFHADTRCTLSGALTDATSAGAPNMFTLLRASSMLTSADAASLDKALRHCYVENRVGSWLHIKDAVVAALEQRVDQLQGEAEEPASGVAPDMPRLCDAVAAFTLGCPAQIRRETQLLGHTLCRSRVVRSGLGLLQALFGRGVPAAYQVNDLLLAFVLEQGADSAALEELATARRAFIAACGLVEETAEAVAALLHANYCTPALLSRLFCRAVLLLGPHAGAARQLRGPPSCLSDSPAVNSAAAQVMAQLGECLHRAAEVEAQQRIARVVTPFVAAVCTDGPSAALTSNTFVPLATRAMLLLELADEDPQRCAALRGPVEGLLEAIRRHLDLPFRLTGAPSPLEQLVPAVHVTSAAEREVVAQYRSAQTKGDGEVVQRNGCGVAVEVMRPLWRAAAFRAEFRLLQLVLRFVAAPPLAGEAPEAPAPAASSAAAQQLYEAIQDFIKDFTVVMPLFTALDLTLWTSAQDALRPPRAPPREAAGLAASRGDMHRLFPLLVTSAFQRFGLQDARRLFFGAWSADACRSIRYASDVPVLSIGAADSPHAKALGDLTTFLSRCPAAPQDPLALWRANMEAELLQVVHCCVPAARSLCEELYIEDGMRSGAAQVAQTEYGLLQMLLEAIKKDWTDKQPTGAFPLRAVALLCALKCRLLLPPSPVDPMYRRGLQADIAREEGRHLERLAEASVWSAVLAQRSPPTAPHVAMVEQLGEAEADRLAAALDGLQERPDPSGRAYATLTRELHRVASTLLSDERLRHATGGAAEQESLDSWGELLLQETAAVLEAYGGYEDATLNLAVAALFTAFSSQVLRVDYGSTRNRSSSNEELMPLPETLRQLQFPAGVSRAVSLPQPGSHHLARRLRYLDSCLTLLKSSVAQTVDPAFAEGLFEAYRSLYRHVEDQNERDRLAEEMAVKYKERSLLIEGDDEKMLRKLRDMFPSYEKEFVLEEEEAEEAVAVAAGESDTRAGHQSRLLFGEKDGVYVRRMVECYSTFYERLLRGRLQQDTFSMKGQLDAYRGRFDVLAGELAVAQRRDPSTIGAAETSQFTAEDERLLLNGFAARAALLRGEFTAASATVAEKNTAGFNVFLDPEPSEVRQFSRPLGRLLDRVSELLEMYPENVTLLLCRRLGKKISELSALKTPLMKVMAGCEVLLRQCYEWERNASAAVSLMTHMNDLSGFVLRWRRLELHCWGHVFKAKRDEFELHAALQWFPLYDAAHGDEGGAGDAVACCLLLFQRLTQFMWSARLGDFSARLRMVKGFAFELACRDGLVAPRTNVVMHVADFFQQFEALITEKGAAAVRPLEEDMANFCQVMRWEDANFYAVRATVEKSHLKVARVLSSLEDALRSPILPLLVAAEEACEEDPALGFPLPPDPAKAAKATKKEKAAKQEAGKKRQRSGKPQVVEELIPSAATAVLWEPFARGLAFLEDGAAELVANVAALQAPKTPQQRKLRALKYLFERLAAAGVPFTHELQVDAWEALYAATETLLSCRTAFSEQPGGEGAEAAALEQYRFCRWVQRMREAERHPHQDLSGAQVKRGTGTVETLLTHLIALSSWTHQLFQLLETLEVLDKAVADSTATAGGDGRVYDAALLDKSLELSAALRVAAASFHWMDQQHSGAAQPAASTTEDRSLLMELQGGADRLWQLCEEAELYRRTGRFLPAAAATALTQQHRRLAGVCGRLQRHSSDVVKAAAAACEERVAAVLRLAGDEEDELWEEGHPVGPRRRLRREGEAVAPAREGRERTATLLSSLRGLCDALEVPLLPASPAAAEAPGTIPAPQGTPGEGEEEEGPEVSETGAYSRYITQFESMHRATDGSLEELGQLLEALREGVGAEPGLVWVQQLTPAEAREARSLLHRARSVCKDAKAGAVRAMTSHAHFGVVLSRLLSVLLKKGLCKAEEQEEQDGEGDGEGGMQQGTGMDDGEGEKDVTNEMENEDQLMNMKDKEEQEQEQEKGKNQDDDEEEEDNAADVETDFQGQKENRDESEEDEEGGESDQEMGEVGDEDDVQERKKSKREEKDTEELNEDEGEQADEVPQDEFEDHEQQGDDEETGGFENKEDEIRDAEEDRPEGSEEDRELVADAEVRSMEDDEEDTDTDSGRSRSGMEQDKEDEVTDDELPTDADEEADDQRSGSEARDNDEREDSDEDRSSRDGEEKADEEEEGDEGSDVENAADAPDENVYEGGQQDDRTGEEATEGQEEKERQQRQQDAAGTDEQQAGDEQEQDDAGRNWKQQQEQNREAQRKDNSERNRSERSNPYKAMKEALQRHRREAPQQLNLNQQVEVQKDEQPDEGKERPPQEAEDEEDVADFQFDEEGPKEGMAAADEFVPPTETAPPDEEAPDAEADDESAGGNDDEEGAEEPQDTRSRRRREEEQLAEIKQEESEEDRRKKSKGGKATAKPLKDEDESSEDDAAAKNEVVEMDLSEKMCRGRQRWQEHEAAVQGLAQQLCEQLRLILAPTLADKLQGDYKTGKRLNMKRIIPYIASQFKKDRIWLRRTKPHKRTYQIMVALDDSLSMQANGAGEFSCRAVTLMAKALQQLEAGEMGVSCFGEETNFLHHLDEPFTAESGPKIFSEVSFSQTSTKLRNFLENMLNYLDDARERLYGQTRSTTQELQQLLYVFSDGQITENRADIRELMVRAEQNHQMVVFVILDVKAAGGSAGGVAPAAAPLTSSDLKGLSASQSVLDMQLVEFKGSTVIRKGYMDEFPFPYYLIVRELERLPEIIADSMRQWFELLNGH